MSTPDGSSPMPLPLRLLSALLPHAEREEVVADVRAEHEARSREAGRLRAWLWLWRQVVVSSPALAGRGLWRGWTGFAPRSDRWRPGGAALEGWSQDVRFTARRLRRRPGYTALAVLTLALGVAGAASAWAVTHRLLLAPLPVAAAEEVAVFSLEGAWSMAEFAHMRPEIEGFRHLAAFRRLDVTLTSGDGPASLVNAAIGTAELFEVLGVGPLNGAGFRPGDDVPGAEPVVVLSHSLWRDLGGDPALVGRTVELAGVPHTVVGVMPSGFWFPDPTTRAWLGLQVNPENESGNYGLIGRLEPGVGIGEMAGPLDRLGTLLRDRFTYPEGWDPTVGMELMPLREYVAGQVRPSLLALLGAMGLLLLIACVNVAALMLGQVDSRGGELTVRTALGAGRPRLLRQLVVEALSIGVLSGLLGAAATALGIRFAVGALPLGELAATVAIDWTVFAAALGIAVVAAAAVALVPAVSLVRGDLRGGLGRTRRGGRLERGLVVAQVALVLLLATGAALLIRSVGNLRAIDPGVRTAGVGVVDIVLPTTATSAERRQASSELAEALAALPGVESAAATQRIPLRGSSDNWGIGVEGRPDLELTATAFRIVTADYFETMGIRLLSGRLLERSDGLSPDDATVVINQALADRYFPGVDPLGQRIGFMDGRWDRIVGVVDNVAESTLTGAAEPARYMLYEHVPWLLTGQTLVFRTAGGADPAPMLDMARRTIQGTAPSVAIRELTTMDRVFDRAVGPARQVMALLSLLSALALTLGVVGVYGVVSHFVTRRRRDWGIRIALGMRPGQVVARIVGDGGTLVGAGVVIGLVGALFAARLLAGFLHDVGPADPLALGWASAVLITAGLLAALVPARRASRIDPAAVLKEE